MAEMHGPEHSLIALVQSVNEQECTCILEDEDGQEFFDVRLTPIVSNKKSFFQLPKLQSYALAIRLENTDEWCLIWASEVDEFVLKSKSAELNLGDKITLKNEKFSLADLMQELFTAIDKLEFATTQGVSMGAPNKLEFAALKNKFKQLLK
jgi:hypothetical protein